jgi:hypothetical protein
VGDFGYRGVRYTCHSKKETVLIWLLILLGLIASEVEARNDQWGESKKEKIRDAIFLIIFASVVSYLAWQFAAVNPLKTVVVLLAVRIAYFDYRVSYLLIRNKVIVGKWWSYSGKTAFTDRLTGRVHWGIRLGLRVVIFAGAVVYYTIG